MTDPSSEPKTTLRLQKWLSQCGVLSRRKAEEAIVAGQVTVNGEIVTELGTSIDPAVDRVRFEGRLVEARDALVTLMVFKPKRVMTTKHDPEGRKTVMDLLPPQYWHLYPVGRLDYDSEGLILLTNDGELANYLMRPSFGVLKTYWVMLDGRPDRATLAKLVSGVELEDGVGKFVSIHSQDDYYEVTVEEGRNRFIRRMFETVGFAVRKLRRVQVGGLALGDLRSAGYRELTPLEVESLRKK